MAVIQSFGALQALTDPGPTWSSTGGGTVGLYGSSQTYAAIYRTQPNVRTVVDFLARNVAQLGLHVFRRISDTDRERLAAHELAGWVSHPNPATTRYRLFESLMIDLGVYLNAFWLKVGDPLTGLVRLPPEQMAIEGALIPTAYEWTPSGGRPQRLLPDRVVHFGGHDPDNATRGLSPLETLRRVLAEEAAAGDWRQALWGNAARFEGVIERPPTAPKWTPVQQKMWREQWQGAYANGGSRPGSVAVLEDGMTFKPTSFSAKDSEFLAARKLTREECAAAYHVPLPMVGILEYATFSNIKEQHKHLYQDCLGPWLEMIEEEVERQLLIECRDQRDVYVEFNIADKLKGSFEEQASSLQMLVGRPLMTANEGRARLNLPSIDGKDANTLAPQQGGPASATASAEDDAGTPPSTEGGDAMKAARLLQVHRARQVSWLEKVPVADRALVFATDLTRWTKELADDLTAVVGDSEALALAAATNAEMLHTLENEAHDA